MSDFALTELLGIHRATVAVADRSSSGPVVTGRSGLVLDGAAAVVIRPRSAPGESLVATGPAAAQLAVGRAVWAPYSGRWRQGAVVAAPSAAPSSHNGGSGGAAAEVEYVADRRGTVLVHRFPVSELRLRDEAP